MILDLTMTRQQLEETAASLHAEAEARGEELTPKELARAVRSQHLAAARAVAPSAKLIRFVDPDIAAGGRAFIVAIEPSSAWHELLPAEQEVRIRRAVTPAEGIPALP